MPSQPELYYLLQGLDFLHQVEDDTEPLSNMLDELYHMILQSHALKEEAIKELQPLASSPSLSS